MSSKPPRRDLDNDRRNEHNWAPLQIRELQSPRMRRQADEARLRAEEIDDYGNVRQPAPERPFSRRVYDGTDADGLREQSPRVYGNSSSMIPREAPPPPESGTISHYQEEMRMRDGEIARLTQQLEAERKARAADKASRSKGGKAKAKTDDPDSVVGPGAGKK